MRRLPLLLCSLLIFLLVSCNAPIAPAPTEQPTAAPTATRRPATATPIPSPTFTPTPATPEYLRVGADDLRGVKVALWTPWVGSPDSEMQALAAEFNRQNEWGIQVQVRSLGSAMVLGEEITLAVEQQSMPQLVIAPDEQLARWEQTRDLLVDLQPYLEHELWGLSEEQVQDFNPAFWAQGQAGASRWSIPATRTAHGLIYNRTWAGELGFDKPPATIEAFHAQVCAAAQVNNTSNQRRKYGTGGWLVSTAPETTLSWLAAFGADPFPTEGEADYRFDQPGVEEALSFYRRLQQDGCLWEGMTPTPYDYFAERFALIYSGTLQDLPLQDHVQERFESVDQWVFIPYPSESGEEVVFAQGEAYAILNSSPEEQLAAWLMLRWLSLPEQQTRLAVANLSLPIGAESQKALSSRQNDFPWSVILPLASEVRPVPAPASWALVQSVLQDAAWQVLRLPEGGQVEQVIADLEAVSQELIQPGTE